MESSHPEHPGARGEERTGAGREKRGGARGLTLRTASSVSIAELKTKSALFCQRMGCASVSAPHVLCPRRVCGVRWSVECGVWSVECAAAGRERGPGGERSRYARRGARCSTCSASVSAASPAPRHGTLPVLRQAPTCAHSAHARVSAPSSPFQRPGQEPHVTRVLFLRYHVGGLGRERCLERLCPCSRARTH